MFSMRASYENDEPGTGPRHTPVDRVYSVLRDLSLWVRPRSGRLALSTADATGLIEFRKMKRAGGNDAD